MPTNTEKTVRIANATTGDRYSEEAVLGHHGIDAENGLDFVRNDALVVRVCLGCASIAVAPDAISRVQIRRRMVNVEPCCEDATTLVY